MESKDGINEEEEDQEVPEAIKANKEDEEEANQEASSGKRKRKRKRKKKTNDQEIPVGEEENNQQESHANRDAVHCTVYVEGIPFDCSSDQVKDFFETHGIQDVEELRLPTWQDSGRLRGYGHILFSSEESFQKALGLSGKYLQKRYLTIQAANAPKSNSRPERNTNDPPPPDCKTLFVHNLPYGASEEDISNVFENYSVENVRIARNSVNRQSKGFCYMDLESPKHAQALMKSKKSFVVGGRRVRLDYDTGRMKGSYRAESGRLWTKDHGDKRQRYDD